MHGSCRIYISKHLFIHLQGFHKEYPLYNDLLGKIVCSVFKITFTISNIVRLIWITEMYFRDLRGCGCTQHEHGNFIWSQPTTRPNLPKKIFIDSQPDSQSKKQIPAFRNPTYFKPHTTWSRNTSTSKSTRTWNERKIKDTLIQS